MLYRAGEKAIDVDGMPQKVWPIYANGQVSDYYNTRKQARAEAKRLRDNAAQAARQADKVDGYDRDNLGESPDH